MMLNEDGDVPGLSSMHWVDRALALEVLGQIRQLNQIFNSEVLSLAAEVGRSYAQWEDIARRANALSGERLPVFDQGVVLDSGKPTEVWTSPFLSAKPGQRSSDLRSRAAIRLQGDAVLSSSGETSEVLPLQHRLDHAYPQSSIVLDRSVEGSEDYLPTRGFQGIGEAVFVGKGSPALDSLKKAYPAAEVSFWIASYARLLWENPDRRAPSRYAVRALERYLEREHRGSQVKSKARSGDLAAELRRKLEL